MARIAVASIIQETNTFSPQPSTLDDFLAQGYWRGAEADERSIGTNTEIAGATERIRRAGHEPVPILRAWAMSGGVLTARAFAHLRGELFDGLIGAGPVDAVVLCLHGALVADGEPAADAALTETCRAALPPGTPVIVTHDLHANLTRRIIAAATALVGFHTYPHIDQGDTGRRGADLAIGRLAGAVQPATVLAKRPMLIPAEAQALADPPMAALRRLADEATTGPILDVSLFPVQPWLDVPELGFGVTVTHSGDAAAAQAVADRIADSAWAGRDAFAVQPVAVDEAVAAVTAGAGPVLLVQSADSPTAGATADSPAVVAALLKRAGEIRAYATLVDAPAVAACHAAGAGGVVDTPVGATLDDRWSAPVRLTGTVARLGADPVVLTGGAMTGQTIALGRWAVLDTGAGLSVLLTERPAPTFDPAGYRHAGLDPAGADAVLVRSATLYRAGFAGLYREAILLDLPGASTPRLDYLTFRNAPRPLHPLDTFPASMTVPLRLADNRVPVYYAGGERISEFRGTAPVSGPEDWVGSLSALPPAILPAGHPADTGVSRTGSGTLTDLVAADPAGWLGERLAAAYGGSSGLLVKLLDAGERLPVHCHPDRAFARARLGSLFGKTEGWIVLAASDDARVWLGMREPVSRDDLRRWIAGQDTVAMLAAMNEMTVRPGQVLYVPAGVPHSIGPGVLITELQEPTSFSVLADHDAFGVGPDAATLGLGWDVAISCFDLSAYAERTALLLPSPRSLAPGVTSLFGPVADEFFRAWQVSCTDVVRLGEQSFAVLVITGGAGELRWDGGRLPIARGETLVHPYAAGPLEFRGEVAAIVCLPGELR